MRIELTTTDDLTPLLLKAEAPDGVTVIYAPAKQTRSDGMMQMWTTQVVPFAIDITKQVAIALIVQWLTNPKFKNRLRLKKNGVSVEISDSSLYELFKDRN